MSKLSLVYISIYDISICNMCMYVPSEYSQDNTANQNIIYTTHNHKYLSDRSTGTYILYV